MPHSQRRLGPAQIALVVAVVAAAGAAYLWWDSDERRVHRRLDSLAAVLNDRSTGELGMISRAAQLAGYLTDDATFDPGRGAGPIRGRERLLALASRAPSDGRDFRVDFLDVTVRVAGEAATTRLTATLTTLRDRSETEMVDAREVEMAWRRTDDWRIARITLIDALERPQR
jgi:hypothetical protein